MPIEKGFGLAFLLKRKAWEFHINMTDYANVFTFTSYQNPTKSMVKVFFLRHKIIRTKESRGKGNINKNFKLESRQKSIWPHKTDKVESKIKLRHNQFTQWTTYLPKGITRLGSRYEDKGEVKNRRIKWNSLLGIR